MKMKMKTTSKYLEECAGACMWPTIAMINRTRVSRAATGCTIKIADRVVRTPEGRSKDEASANRSPIQCQ